VNCRCSTVGIIPGVGDPTKDERDMLSRAFVERVDSDEERFARHYRRVLDEQARRIRAGLR
jgi:hypothetical protein